MHKAAPAAHQASVAAQKQGRFWEFHDRVFADQKNLEIDALRRHAQALGLDLERFEKDLLDTGNKAVIDRDAQEAASLGVTGTPAFFVNGRYLSGAKPFEEFAKVINAELTKLELPVPEAAGAP